MKTIDRIILTTLVLLLMEASSAEAALYQTGSSNFGPDSITVDTSTDLGWLNMRETAGLSYEQVLSQTQAGGIFSGFRFATEPEVLGLFSSAGIPGPGLYPLSSPSIQSLFSLIGTSGTIQGFPGVYALSGTPGLNGSRLSPAIYALGVNGVEEYLVSDGTGLNVTTSSPTLSSWLVTDVPEPADAILITLAAAVWCGFRYLKRKNGHLIQRGAQVPTVPSI